MSIKYRPGGGILIRNGAIQTCCCPGTCTRYYKYTPCPGGQPVCGGPPAPPPDLPPLYVCEGALGMDTNGSMTPVGAVLIYGGVCYQGVDNNAIPPSGAIVLGNGEFTSSDNGNGFVCGQAPCPVAPRYARQAINCRTGKVNPNLYICPGGPSGVFVEGPFTCHFAGGLVALKPNQSAGDSTGYATVPYCCGPDIPTNLAVPCSRCDYLETRLYRTCDLNQDLSAPDAGPYTEAASCCRPTESAGRIAAGGFYIATDFLGNINRARWSLDCFKGTDPSQPGQCVRRIFSQVYNGSPSPDEETTFIWNGLGCNFGSTSRALLYDFLKAQIPILGPFEGDSCPPLDVCQHITTAEYTPYVKSIAIAGTQVPNSTPICGGIPTTVRMDYQHFYTATKFAVDCFNGPTGGGLPVDPQPPDPRRPAGGGDSGSGGCTPCEEAARLAAGQAPQMKEGAW